MPTAKPFTMPDADPIEAMAVLLLLHVPSGVVLVRVVKFLRSMRSRHKYYRAEDLRQLFW